MKNTAKRVISKLSVFLGTLFNNGFLIASFWFKVVEMGGKYQFVLFTCFDTNNTIINVAMGCTCATVKGYQEGKICMFLWAACALHARYSEGIPRVEIF